MGLMDELRQKAADLQKKEQGESARRLNAEEIYRTQIKPKLNQLYLTLGELVKHLNYINPDLQVPYRFNVEGLEIRLKQQDYRVAIDSTNETREVTLAFKCVHPIEVKFVSKDKASYEENLEYLKKHGLGHQCHPCKNDKHEVTGAHFIVKSSVPVNFIFRADLENAQIKLIVANFDGLGVVTHTFQPEKFTEEFFDQLGRHIIRENPNMFKESIGDDVKEALRARIEEEKRQRLEELEEAEKLEAAEDERQKNEGSRFGFLKKIRKSNNGS